MTAQTKHTSTSRHRSDRAARPHEYTRSCHPRRLPFLLGVAWLVLGALTSTAHPLNAQAATASLVISLAHDDEPERRTRDQLLRLAAAHDLSPWLFTREIAITSDRQVIPHSHPVLTLTTRHLRDDELLLSTFVHEQLHWYLDSRPREVLQAVQAVRELVAPPPVGPREGGATADAVHRHLLVCRLEYSAMKQLLGELRAREVMQFWAGDHYPWIYAQVLEHDQELGGVLQRVHLFPIVRE